MGLGLAIILGSLVCSRWRGASLALATALANLILFILAVLAWALLGNSRLTQGWSLVHRAGSLDPGEALALLTSMYAHADLPHILYNMMALVLLGLPLEQRVGPRALGTGYLASGLAGGLAFLLINFSADFVLLGASGAVSGLFGMFARLYPRERLAILPIPMYLLFVLNLLAQFLLAAYIGGPVAYPAHIVGAATGFGLAPLLVGGPRPTRGPAAPSLEYLAPLATTSELREILLTLRAETLPEIREAWLARFQERARCPRCGGPLTWVRGSARSACGWALRRP